AWRFPGHVDGWILATDEELAAMPANAKGFAIGRLRPDAPKHGGMHWQFSLPKEDGDRITLDCSRLEVAEPALAFVVTLVAALMILPGTIRFMQDEGSPGARFSFRRWSSSRPRFCFWSPSCFSASWTWDRGTLWKFVRRRGFCALWWLSAGR